MTSEDDSTLKQALVRAGEKYRDRTTLRAAVQAIPYVGGPIDTLLSGHAGRRQEARFASFLDDLDNRLRRIEDQPKIEETDEFFDLILDVFERVIRSRSRAKRERFAQIIVNQVQGGRDWDTAGEVVRLLDGLSDIHMEVLREALSAPPCDSPFDGLNVISLAVDDLAGDDIIRPTKLKEALPGYSAIALRMACSELVARGLLHDEGIGRWDFGALQYLVPTDLARWFVRQVSGDT
ncbi:MAG: hypothetical protein AB7N70_22655 [Dehalococcoidia bacterium]